MPPRLRSNPLFQESPIAQQPPVHHLRLHLCLARVKAQQRRHLGDHVRLPQSGRHDIWRIVFDLRIGYAAFRLANSLGLDQAAQKRRNLAAGRAVGRSPEGQEGPAGSGGLLQVSCELVLVAHAGGGGRVLATSDSDLCFGAGGSRGKDSVLCLLVLGRRGREAGALVVAGLDDWLGCFTSVVVA